MHSIPEERVSMLNFRTVAKFSCSEHSRKETAIFIHIELDVEAQVDMLKLLFIFIHLLRNQHGLIEDNQL